jgi:hypothetical protein
MRSLGVELDPTVEQVVSSFEGRAMSVLTTPAGSGWSAWVHYDEAQISVDGQIEVAVGFRGGTEREALRRLMCFCLNDDHAPWDFHDRRLCTVNKALHERRIAFNTCPGGCDTPCSERIEDDGTVWTVELLTDRDRRIIEHKTPKEG